MKLTVPAVCKKDNKWFIGFLDGYKFEVKKEIKKLADVKDVSDYKGLITFLRTGGYERKEAEKILKKTGCDSLYVLMKPVELDEKQFTKFWWMDHYQKCKNCIHDCKQSHMIKDLKCKKFKRG